MFQAFFCVFNDYDTGYNGKLIPDPGLVLQTTIVDNKVFSF